MSRRLQTGANAVLVAALAVAVVAVAVELADRHPLRFDLSRDRVSEAQPDTAAALGALGDRAPLRVTAFGPRRRDADGATRERLLQDFLAAVVARDPTVEVRTLDLDRDRREAERLGVDRYGTVVLEAGDRRVDLPDRELFRVRAERSVEFVGEAAFAAGVRRLVAGGTRPLVVLSGHGERRIFDRGLGELVALSEVVERLGFEARTVDLLRDAAPGTPPEVPPDAQVVLLVAPSQPLAPSESDALRAWVTRGGSLAVFVDPTSAAPEVLGALGVEVLDGVALDPTSFFPHADRPLLRYGAHPITAPLSRDGLATVAAVAAPLRLDPRPGVTGTPLLRTSPQGWIERGRERPATFDPAVDVPGPVDVAFAIDAGGARVLVVGDGDLLQDELMDDAPGNRTFVGQALRWLSRSDEHLATGAHAVGVRRVALDRGRLDAIRWVLIGGVPALIGLLGLAVNLARRAR